MSPNQCPTKDFKSFKSSISSIKKVLFGEKFDELLVVEPPVSVVDSVDHLVHLLHRDHPTAADVEAAHHISGKTIGIFLFSVPLVGTLKNNKYFR